MIVKSKSHSRNVLHYQNDQDLEFTDSLQPFPSRDCTWIPLLFLLRDFQFKLMLPHHAPSWRLRAKICNKPSATLMRCVPRNIYPLCGCILLHIVSPYCNHIAIYCHTMSCGFLMISCRSRKILADSECHQLLETPRLTSCWPPWRLVASMRMGLQEKIARKRPLPTWPVSQRKRKRHMPLGGAPTMVRCTNLAGRNDTVRYDQINCQTNISKHLKWIKCSRSSNSQWRYPLPSPDSGSCSDLAEIDERCPSKSWFRCQIWLPSVNRAPRP